MSEILDVWIGKSIDCACGLRHEVLIRRIVIERDALAQVKVSLSVIRENAMVEVAADEEAIVQVMLDTPLSSKVLLAVGAGTVHDIVRFVAHRTKRPFLSEPTAPSVDGFASVGAPLIVRGFKQTIPACAPEAIFADLAVLAKAPQAMIAAGLGDMLGKHTSLADWSLGRVLLGEHYCELSARLTLEAVELHGSVGRDRAAHRSRLAPVDGRPDPIGPFHALGRPLAAGLRG
ncbi:glycerol dehydrogenase-like iron-containing ADH family enzyme [Paenibacillus sp. V4I9]|uniref:iron-containing alcohol dehydrogenase n=1 Tax=Paenibacillus sp. V4I9 TaxID=3042308 RepID=UPI00277D371E|nr:iron-containing alcohol dehydrogenase [Paenibacillus sp. V4I9]MDQ0890521.1 glycerol dehydrogenase-like iron-containing ADH family enzyme [Paenibacillus sp. V4I9]